MKIVAGMILAVMLMGIGFYARGACQTITVVQQQPEMQIAQETQNAFTKLADRLNKGGR